MRVVLVITNEEIEKYLEIGACVDALEAMYREYGLGLAVEIPRQDGVIESRRPGAVHALKTMSGSQPSAGVCSVRINSDIIHWPVVNGSVRRTKIPVSQGSRYNGLVLLFSAETGELLCIFNDGFVQKTRVGATSGVGARTMARSDARRLGVIGAGWQASSQVEAMAAVRPIEAVTVYSPNPGSRTGFAERMATKIGLPVTPVASPEEAMHNADIVVSATNSMSPTIEPGWLRPGMHVTCVRSSELSWELLNACDRVAVNTKQGVTAYATKGFASEIPEFTSGDYARPREQDQELGKFPELKDVVAGNVPARRSDDEITCFYNSKGIGLQFACMGALVLAGAKEHGYGVELEDTLFSQLVHP